MRNILVLFVLFIKLSVAYGQHEVLFNKATEAYNKEQFKKAVTYYEQIIEGGKHSSELYFNLGNCYYKMDKIGPSIYYYEKALLLKPNDQEILNNLGYAKNMRIDAIEEIPKTVMARFYENVVGALTFDQWATLAILFVFLFVATYLGYYFYNNATNKRIFFIGSMACLTITILAVLFAYLKYQDFNADNPAIVFAKEVAVTSAPNKNGDEIFQLHEGSKVIVLEALNDWNKVKIADGQTGWLPSETIKLLKDF